MQGEHTVTTATSGGAHVGAGEAPREQRRKAGEAMAAGQAQDRRGSSRRTEGKGVAGQARARARARARFCVSVARKQVVRRSLKGLCTGSAVAAASSYTQAPSQLVVLQHRGKDLRCRWRIPACSAEGEPRPRVSAPVRSAREAKGLHAEPALARDVDRSAARRGARRSNGRTRRTPRTKSPGRQ